MDTCNINIGPDCENIINDYVNQLKYVDKMNKVLEELKENVKWKQLDNKSSQLEYGSITRGYINRDGVISFYINDIGEFMLIEIHDRVFSCYSNTDFNDFHWELITHFIVDGDGINFISGRYELDMDEL